MKNATYGLLATPILAGTLAAQRAVLGPEPPSATVGSGIPASFIWGDYDGDGLADALAFTPNGELRLLRNAGDGSFEDLTEDAGLAAVRSAAFGVWEDYDGDGQIDLFVGTNGGPSHLFRNQGEGLFEDVAAASGLDVEQSDRSAEWLDYDADGRLDLHLVTEQGNHVYHALGDSLFERVELDLPQHAAWAFGTFASAGPAREMEPDAVRPSMPDTRPSSASRSGLRVPLDVSLHGLGDRSASLSVAVAGGATIGFSASSAAGSLTFFDCLETITDQATGDCLIASSTPTSGVLYPYPGANNVFVPPAFVGGGDSNQAIGPGSMVGGGRSNTAVGNGRFGALTGYATVGGGYGNTALTQWDTVGGGYGNTADGYSFYAGGATVSGGINNNAYGGPATIGGGRDNTANGGTIGGGYRNTVRAGTVAGGSRNTAGLLATVGGGSGQTASGSRATVGGGSNNTASGCEATIGGGYRNMASATNATVGGGDRNSASGNDATIGGGAFNNAFGARSTIGGGRGNVASGGGASTVGGGDFNGATGNRATVPGGSGNRAVGDFSFAAGRRAKAMHTGTFVWGDSQVSVRVGPKLVEKTSSAVDQFNVYCSGGARFFTNNTATTGVLLAPGSGSWSSVSDRDSKENVDPVDGRQVLERLVAVPMATWNYKAQDDSIRHMGPMAQDFYAAFGLGLGDKTIDTIDPNGVALAAIQGLNEVVEENEKRLAEKDAEIAANRDEIEALRAQLSDLACRLEAQTASR